MKIGDLVKLTATLKVRVGVIVGIDPCGWFSILRSDGTLSLWPESQMEVINENR